MNEQPDWKKHQEQTKEKPHARLLEQAISYLGHKGKALDIGGGALGDSRFLLKQGFDVTDLDQQELAPEMTVGLDKERFRQVVSSFADFEFPKGEYDVANAMWSLPFNPPETFRAVFGNVKQSLRVGGIFCGQFFGDRDEWSANPDMTFHTREQVQELLADMETLLFKEEEWDGTLASGIKKHWHAFHVIAKKL